MVRHVDEALDAGAIGVSTGLIYPPGMHGSARGGRGARRGRVPPGSAVRDPHAQRVGRRARGDRRGGHDRALCERGGETQGRLQVSHLKAGAKAVWGQGPALVERLERAGRPASTWRPTSTRTRRPRRPSRRCSRRRSSRSTRRTRRLPSASPRRGPGPRGAGERAQPAGRTSPRIRAGTGSSSLAAPPGPSGAAEASRRSREDLGGDPWTSRWTCWPTTGSTSTSSSTAWPRPTSRRSCGCRGSRSAPTPAGAVPATRSSTTASRIRAATARPHASSAATRASGACSRSRPRSRS